MEVSFPKLDLLFQVYILQNQFYRTNAQLYAETDYKNGDQSTRKYCDHDNINKDVETKIYIVLYNCCMAYEIPEMNINKNTCY